MGVTDTHQTPHVVYVFDAGFRYCTLVSAYSVLKYRPADIRISFLAGQDMPEFARAAAALMRAFPDADIALRPEPVLDLRFEIQGHLPPATFGRLLLPQLVSGRVLYLDGDTFARRDIGPLFHADLHGRPFGAMRDPPIERDLHYVNLPLRAKVKPHLAAYLEHIELFDMASYFNAGIMVIDLDRAAELGVLDDIFDLPAAVEFVRSHNFAHADQSWLNHKARGQVALLDPIWNSLWGNPRTNRLPLPPRRQFAYRASRRDPAIVHLAGPVKPWLDHGKRLSRAMQRWNAEYRALMNEADRTLGLDLREMLL